MIETIAFVGTLMLLCCSIIVMATIHLFNKRYKEAYMLMIITLLALATISMSMR